MKANIIVFGLMLISVPMMANAGALDLLDTSLRDAITGAMGGLQTTAILWLSSFVLLQFLITQLGLLKSGADIEAIYGKLLGSLLWFGFCFYVMSNGVDFIDQVSQGFITKAGQISGAGSFNAGDIIGNGTTIAANLIASINQASGIMDLFLPALLGGLLGLVIIATAALIAFKVFLIKIETMLIIMLAPLSFSFLGLNALKDQGIAPFKSLISLLYRIMFLAVILKAMGSMSANLVSVINSITSDSIDGIWSAMFAAVVGYVLLGFLAFKSDSLASNLASGSTNLGTGDVASAAAMGAAAGAALATGGVAAAGAAATGGKSMGDVMKNMMGGGGSVSNATPGSGSGPVGQPPANPANMSTSGARGGSSGGAANASGSGFGGAPKQDSTAPAGPSPAETAAGWGADTQVSPQQSLGTQTAAGGNAGSGATAGIGGATNASGGSGGGAPKQETEAQGSLPAETAANAGPVFDSVTAAGGAPEAALAAQSAANAGAGTVDVAQAAMKATPGGAFPEGGSAHKQMTDAVAKGMTPVPVKNTSGSGNAPGQPDPAPSPAQTAAGGKAGSGATAGIGGAGSPLEKQLGDLVQALSQPKDAAKPSFTDRMGALNQLVAQEKAVTSVSINTHNSD